MNYWLIKSEADEYSIDNLKRDKKIAWEGVRNFQARNFMKDQMKVKDLAIFYHTNVDMGVYGIAKVVSKSHPDLSAQNARSEYFDPRATADKPIWYCVDFAYVKKFKKPLTLQQIKNDPILKTMRIAQRGNRLSITPVAEKEYNHIIKLCH